MSHGNTSDYAQNNQFSTCKSNLFTMNWKVFNDLVHGHMTFHPLIVNIIDTPQFQRLRHLKQIGPSFFVYPTAVHNRFEHSLGTCHLAGKLMDSLNRKRRVVDNSDHSDEERRKETLCVQIAGLCHDLGHGPFSHLWERFLKRCNIDWKHEICSIEIFESILDEIVSDKENAGENISILELFRRYDMEKYIPNIKKMIFSGQDEVADKKYYLYQVVSNRWNDIDVDKWDYILRDSKMVNLPISFDCDRLFEYCQILETNSGNLEICFRDKECTALINMFISRGMLHDKVYQHKKVRIIEEMLIDAFYFARHRLNLTSTSVNSMLKLTDHIYNKILFENFGKDKNMLEAKAVLQKLEKRKLYICIAAKEIELTSDDSEYLTDKIEDDIYKYLREKDENLDRSFIKSLLISIDMTKSNLYKPLKNVMIYEKQNSTEKKFRPEAFDWDKFHYGLKPDLKNLNRIEIMILYKGGDRIRYKENCYNSLLENLLKKHVIVNGHGST